MFFKDDNGCKIFSPESDVWSACITLMHVLEGKYKNDGTLDQVLLYCSYGLTLVVFGLYSLSGFLKMSALNYLRLLLNVKPA